MCSKLFTLFIISLLLSQKVISQSSEKITLKKYGLNDGLSSFNVRKIVQDKYGYVWIATQEGLDRFDGNKFINYTKSGNASQRLSGIDIREVIEDTARNILWVLPGENGLNGIDLITGRVIKEVPITQQSHDDWNIAMVKRQNDIYVATNNGIRVIDIKESAVKTSLLTPAYNRDIVKKNEVRTIKVDPANNIWAFYTKQGFTIYGEDNKIVKANLFASESGNNLFVKSLEFVNDSSALAATNTGVYKIFFSKNYNARLEKIDCADLSDCEINDLSILASDQVLIATNKGLFITDKLLSKFCKYVDQKEDLKGDWLQEIKDISEDNYGNVWLSCIQGAAYISNVNRPFQNYYVNPKTGERLEHILGLSVLRNNELFISLSDGLAVLGSDKYFTYKLKNLAFSHVFEDANKNIIASTEKGAFLYKNNKLIPIATAYSEFAKYATFEINSHVFWGDSLLILGTEKSQGVLLWNYVTKTIRHLQQKDKDEELSSNIINGLYKDSKQCLWVLSDYTVDLFDRNLKKLKTLFLKNPANGQNLNLFFDVCEADGFYWLASYGSGVVKLNSNYEVMKVFDKRDGLSNEGVYQVYDAAGSIFITSNNGLSVLNVSSQKFTNYYENQGLHSNSFEERAGFKVGEKIYAGGIKGFTIIDAVKVKQNTTAPAIYIRSISIETETSKVDTANISIKKLTIPNNVLQTTIYVSGINWSSPEHTTFSYRIIENSTQWTNIGTLHSIPLIAVKPGTYHLQVKAANEDGMWSEPKEIILIFEPKWYQTWWFFLGIALAVAGILYALYRYRISQIKKQHEIRKNIATDLHDDLGSTLNSVKVFTNLAISGVKQEESLQQVKDNLTEATMSLRDMIWVLDDSLDTVDELVTRLKQFAIPVTAASNIEFSINAGSDVNSRQLTKEEKRNLFLICKEAINNSIKYSGGTQITVDIKPAGKKIHITLADNGKGFDEASVKKGYGLKNMQYRAGQIKYNVVLKSSPDHGAQITILPS